MARIVTPEMLATAHLDQPPSISLPHTAFPSVNCRNTYRSQYPFEAATIRMGDAFIRPAPDLPKHWENKMKAEVLACFQIVGQVPKNEVMVAFEIVKGTLEQIPEIGVVCPGYGTGSAHHRTRQSDSGGEGCPTPTRDTDHGSHEH